VTDHSRITDAPSLYTLGVAYSIAPDKVEAFLAANRKKIERLFTGHGPWEGYNTTRNEAIRFQTTAHTLALIMGGIGSAEENMQRYLTWQGVTSLSKVLGGESGAVDLLGGGAQWISWSPVGDRLEASQGRWGFRIRGEAVRNGAITIKMPQEEGVNLSNGALLIRYRAGTPLKTVITLNGGSRVFENQVFARFDACAAEKEIRIPLPATPGLENVKELVIRFGDTREPVPADLTISGFEFVP
jgi:hypothetical protein